MKSNSVEIFNANTLGQSLKETTVRTTKTNVQDIVTVWCHSHKGVDLYYWKDERGNIIKQQMQYLGQIAEWNVIEGTRTGVVIENEVEGKEESHISYDEEVMGLTVEQIVLILHAAVSLNRVEREAMIRNFSESRHFGTLSVPEVLSLYGRAPTLKNVAAAWWDRIVYAVQFRLHIRLSKKPRR